MTFSISALVSSRDPHISPRRSILNILMLSMITTERKLAIELTHKDEWTIVAYSRFTKNTFDIITFHGK